MDIIVRFLGSVIRNVIPLAARIAEGTIMIDKAILINFAPCNQDDLGKKLVDQRDRGARFFNISDVIYYENGFTIKESPWMVVEHTLSGPLQEILTRVGSCTQYTKKI